MRKYPVIMIIVTFVFCFSMVSSATAASDEEEIIQVQKNFMKAYTTKNFNLMSSLYLHSSNTSTFNPGGQQPLLFKGWDETLKDGWKTGLDSRTEAVTMDFVHPQVTMIKDDVAVLTGYEVIAATNPTTKEETVSHNRVTRVVQKINGKWLIVHDHVTTFSIK